MFHEHQQQQHSTNLCQLCKHHHMGPVPSVQRLMEGLSGGSLVADSAGGARPSKRIRPKSAPATGLAAAGLGGAGGEAQLDLARLDALSAAQLQRCSALSIPLLVPRTHCWILSLKTSQCTCLVTSDVWLL